MTVSSSLMWKMSVPSPTIACYSPVRSTLSLTTQFQFDVFDSLDVFYLHFRTFKNALKSTDLIVILKAVKELKSTIVFRQKVPYRYNNTVYKECSYNICTTSLLIKYNLYV